MEPTTRRDPPPRTVLRVDNPRELLAYLPHHLGFQPSESVVAVSLRRPRREVGLVARADLADIAHPGRGPAVARGLVRHVDSDGAAQLYVVLYERTDPRRPGPRGLQPESRRRAVRAAEHLRDAAAGVLGHVPVWVVTEKGYLDLDCTDAACCPPGGRPLRELESAVVSAHLVLAGSAVAGRRADVARIDPAGPTARRAAARAAQRWLSVLERAPGAPVSAAGGPRVSAAACAPDSGGGGAPASAASPTAVSARACGSDSAAARAPDSAAVCGSDSAGACGSDSAGACAPDSAGAGAPVSAANGTPVSAAGRDAPGGGAAAEAWRRESVALWRAMERAIPADRRADARGLGRLAAGLADRDVRDAVLVALLPGTGALPERMVSRPTASQPEIAAALGTVFGDGVGASVPPDPVRTAMHVDLLEAVVSHAPRRLQPAPLALLGVLAWWRGEGARASLLVARCLGADPAYRLALVLDSALEAGLPPSWARSAARQPGGGAPAALVG